MCPILSYQNIATLTPVYYHPMILITLSMYLDISFNSHLLSVFIDAFMSYPTFILAISFAFILMTFHTFESLFPNTSLSLSIHICFHHQWTHLPHIPPSPEPPYIQSDVLPFLHSRGIAYIYPCLHSYISMILIISAIICKDSTDYLHNFISMVCMDF